MTQQANPSTTTERSQAAVALDNLIRRHLRVSDPTDPEAISKALRERYTEESHSLYLESSGLAQFRDNRGEARSAEVTTVSAEVRQARDDVSLDLNALINNALLKDVHPELRGWSQTIHQAVSDGINSARFALDPWQRDQAMAVRRLMGDYARIARYVGAITPNMSIHFRKLAQSLDEVAAVVLVLMGDALAQTGYAGGRFLLQAPASELQARRDGVINALRNLVGTAQESYGPNDWPRSLVAYRRLLNYLEDNGQTDLRALFQEGNVARTLDELIHWANSGAADDLRALGAMAHLNLERFRRLEMLLRRRVDPSAPALAAYLTAIRLFLDAFDNAGSGYRLLYVARPPIAFYGLYGVGGPDTATRRLLDLILYRGRLAEILDCYLGCDCGTEQVNCQIMLDKVLYDVDRAIDLYVMGQSAEGNGEAEQRAVAYGVVADRVLRCGLGLTCGLSCSTSPNADEENTPCDTRFAQCVDVRCVDRHPDLAGTDSEPGVLKQIRDLLWFPESLSEGENDCELDAHASFGLDALRRVLEELCIQRESEARWESLLHTMAPSCRIDNGILGPTTRLIDSAIEGVLALDPDPDSDDRLECPTDYEIPPHFETSLAGLAFTRGSAGELSVTDESN